ncbi:MAG: hypothetical protein M3247_03960 [Thermoproteota archaeon]|nr:hypothetical protein [Thermoproteota archaeon]
MEPERLVLPGESPVMKNKAVIQKFLRGMVNDQSKHVPMRGVISLTDDEVKQLRTQAAPDGTVPESAVKAIIAKNEPSRTSFLHKTDLLPLCRPNTPGTNECISVLEEPAVEEPAEPAEEHSESAPTADVSVTSEDMPEFVGRLLRPVTAPEEQILTGLMPTATIDSVKSNIQNLQFPPSPADVPAFHDFYQLQIAFQHVWQELTDRGVLDIAQDAYETIVELGGDPNRPEYKNSIPLATLSEEALLALRAHRAAPPPVVRDHRGDGGSNNPDTASGGVVVTSDHRPPPSVNPPHDSVEERSTDPRVRLPALITELESRLRQKYAFTIFAANAQERSVNFGIFNTFRQVWTPLDYQAGALVKSIPLAPQQSQKVVVTRKTLKKRTQKELEKNLRVTKDETSQTSRAEQEIANRASTKLDIDISNTAKGGVEGIGSDTTTTTFKQDATKSSDDIKKSYRESVFKAAQEVTLERTTEITTENSEEVDVTETTEIKNPNDEIAVTYLFYELQRRYRLHERLFRVTPVVLVAQEVPAPHEIDQAWLIAHDWILKRAILDDSFIPTLETLSKSSGRQTAIEQLGANVSQQRQIVAQLRNELAIVTRQADSQSTIIRGAVDHRTRGDDSILGEIGSAVTDIVSKTAVAKAAEMIFGGSSDQNQSNENVLHNSADEAADRARELTFRLEREVTALNSLTETYTKALEVHYNHLTEIARLCVHVKEHILYYMQAIWKYEPADQRFFRLHNTPVPTFKKQQQQYRIAFEAPLRSTLITQPHNMLERFGGRNATTFPVEVSCQIQDEFSFEPLSEVADLDNLLGFKGNYMIFPLFESNPLTDYMMEPYVDRATQELVDPSDPSGWSLDEFSEYVCCLKSQLSKNEFRRLKPILKDQYQKLLTAPRRSDDVLVVPTNSLFIECLPAKHSLIEQFKRDHRMMDVKKVQGEVREKELENIRRAAKVLAGERDDPHIDKKVLIEGDVKPDVDVDEN